MQSAPSNLTVRLATAGVVAPLIIVLLYAGPPWGFFAMVAPAALLGAWELFQMTHPDDRPSQVIGVGLTACVLGGLFFGTTDLRVAVTLLAFPLLGPLVTLVRLGDMGTAGGRAFAMGFGPLFIGAPLAWLAMLRRDMGNQGPGYVLLALALAWWGDTGGYFAGRFLGRRKLYEAVSPKKTIEGAIGGLFGSLLAGLVAHFWTLLGVDIPLAHVIPLALLAGVLGQAGDLGESLIKRATGVKDSGAIVPGHGGILDRVDALILTSAVVYLYTVWFQSSLAPLRP